MLNILLSALPPVFILTLVVWFYYFYNIQFCLFLVAGLTKKSFYIATSHVLLIMFLWSFLQTMCERHDPVPNEYRLDSIEHDRLLRNSEDEANLILKKIINGRRLEIYTCASNSRIRYCKICMSIKPDRTHHCSTCTKCILKMDHHCPWISNCVGFCNYKQFILSLMYAMMWCFFYAATVAEYLTEIYKDFQNNMNKLMIGVGFLVACFTSILVAILFFYHLSLLCRNETTLEALRETTFIEDNATFDLGKWRNFTEVFGENMCCWLLPVQSGRGNGYEFQVGHLIT